MMPGMVRAPDYAGNLDTTALSARIGMTIVMVRKYENTPHRVNEVVDPLVIERKGVRI